MNVQERYDQIRAEMGSIYKEHRFYDDFDRFVELYLDLRGLQTDPEVGGLKSTIELDLRDYQDIFAGVYSAGRDSLRNLGTLPLIDQDKEASELEYISRNLLTVEPDIPGLQSFLVDAYYRRGILNGTIRVGDPLLN